MASGVAPSVSVVIPVLDEAARIRSSVLALPRDGGIFEVLIVDGGSGDGTCELARAMTAEARDRGIRLEVLQAERGRAGQMNAGAARARGSILLFLHADTLLPEAAFGAIRAILEDPGVIGGGFRHAFQEASPGLRLISAASNLRARLWGTFYGDQAIFVRRSAFEALGGFRPLPVFEDADLSARMRRLGRTVLLRPAVRTSARRYLQAGVGRTAWRMARMKLAYLCGQDPLAVAGDNWAAGSRAGDGRKR
jgi:rSAM/selenodomain-associated transferase 2